MKRTEYEYSIPVKELAPFIDYCQSHGYQKEEEMDQTRILYRKADQTMARITINEQKGQQEIVLDFKEDKLSKEVVLERRESLPLVINSREAVESILTFLGYQKSTILKRNRQVYKKEQVTFELDQYVSPNCMFVVAIEGEKQSTDRTYEEIKEQLGTLFCQNQSL